MNQQATLETTTDAELLRQGITSVLQLFKPQYVSVNCGYCHTEHTITKSTLRKLNRAVKRKKDYIGHGLIGTAWGGRYCYKKAIPSINYQGINHRDQFTREF